MPDDGTIYGMCKPCERKFSAYNKARYANDPKPWPSKALCASCRKALRGPWKKWRKDYIARHPDRVAQQQRDYRDRLRRAG